jgi:hypothetical protein
LKPGEFIHDSMAFQPQLSRESCNCASQLYILHISRPKGAVFPFLAILCTLRLLEEELAEKLKDEEIPLISAEEVRESEG